MSPSPLQSPLAWVKYFFHHNNLFPGLFPSGAVEERGRSSFTAQLPSNLQSQDGGDVSPRCGKVEQTWLLSEGRAEAEEGPVTSPSGPQTLGEGLIPRNHTKTPNHS